jgi:hypothetical protein
MRYLTQLVLGFALCFWSEIVRAEYKFVTDNPFVAQKQLFDDILSGHTNLKSLGPRAAEAISKESIFSATPEKLRQLGPIIQICFFTGFKYPTSRTFAFRTFHHNGCGDWAITSDISSETLTGIVMIPVKLLPGRTDACGPPGIIPPAPAAGDSFDLPGSLKCRNVNDLSPPKQTDELLRACELNPGFCK